MVQKSFIEIENSSSKLQKIGVTTPSFEFNYGFLEVFRNFLVETFAKNLNFLQ